MYDFIDVHHLGNLYSDLRSWPVEKTLRFLFFTTLPLSQKNKAFFIFKTSGFYPDRLCGKRKPLPASIH